jgi:hypothetical protein
MLICPLFSGCSFSLSCFSSLKLSTPEITLHSSSKCISWESVNGAKCYDVYCDDTYVESITNDKELDSFVYDFSSSIKDSRDYEFYIIAIANAAINEDSEKSNVVKYTGVTVSAPPSAIYNTVIQTANNNIALIPYVINGTKIQFIPYFEDEWAVDGYELYMYSNSTGLNVYPISLDTPSGDGYEINLLSSQFQLKDEIYAVRMGVVVGEEHLVCSDMEYINPDKHFPYTDDIYIFDGYINDCYIESIEELRNLVYYNFVYKITAQNIKLSPDIARLIYSYSSSGGNDMASRVQAAVIDCFSYFFETRDEYLLTVATLNSATHQYCIKVGYKDAGLLNASGKAEPDTGLIPPGYAYKDIDWEPYYETCGQTMRDKDPKYATEKYDNFPADKHFLYTKVTTSEQLYWAVENKITPICPNGTTAKSIYDTAKKVLNSIIADTMTDYEKVLSIFDWINDNTSYDYYSLIDGCYDNAAGTITPAYYLEGVFSTGYAVCDGFSKAFSLLCNMEGIECTRIVGYAGTGSQLGGHAWNKVLLDVDESDGIDAEYYLVDITWTELKGSTYFESAKATGEEATSHEYFLINDDYVADTHHPFAKREKFAYYRATSTFDYYSSVKYEFNGRDYGLLTNSQTNMYDAKIDSDEDLEVMFRYMFVNNLEAMEVLITYDYIEEIYQTSTEVDWYQALVAKMRSKKFVEQYIFINTNGILNKNTGIILVLENNLLIDDDNEVGHLVEYLSHYNVYGTYDLYVTGEMLKKAPAGIDELSMVRSLFGYALSTHDINIEFTFVGNRIVDLQGKTESHYIIKITPKNT